ncbi:hypothetical protein [Carboxylicivirga marina]|uniref:Uncharacterized protein n=1 Tax=Carboxylicivirga marina TaxID=2800988 RepID=A0ABS1HGB2_9BACT|nr:hypothetical protein [Carboxylicivirga marina]MBK3516671.1 hypothetical protein [Carboxylicivirga marina]
MNYILKEIERLVTNIGNPEICLIKNGISNEEYLKSDIDNIHIIIKEQLLSESSGLRSDKKLSSSVRFYQSCLIRLIDQLQSKKCTCREALNCHNAKHNPLIKELTEALVFINEQYANFFDIHSNLPEVCYHKHKEAFIEHRCQISTSLKNQKINPQILEVLLNPLNEFIERQKENYTFHDKHYIYKWIKRLYAINLPLFNDDKLQDFYCKEIIAYNLNSEETIQFITNHIIENYRYEENRADQLYTLKHFHKCIKQTRTINKAGYCPDKPSIKKTLLVWLEAEINFLEPNQLTIDPMPKIGTLKNKKSKHNINTSVANLGCFLRVLVDTTYIEPTSKQALFRLFHENFKSKESDEISIQNISNNFYSPLPSSWEAVKDDVLNILNYIHKNKN